MTIEELIKKSEEIKKVQYDSSLVSIWKNQVLQFVKEFYGKEYYDILLGKIYQSTESQGDLIEIANDTISFLNELLTIDTASSTPSKNKDNKLLSNLHKEIFDKCSKLYEDASYAEAVEKSFKVVRDKLRKLTGFETGSEAFGKGKLFIKGATAPNVENDFNEGVRFLTMAIDKFRNEKAHTSDAEINNPIRAYEYLRLSSLAMDLLDNSEIRQR